MMGNYIGNSMMGYGEFGLIPMILWWALIVISIVFLVRWAFGQSRTNLENRGKMASDILKERYAKSEIDKQEFEEKKKDLVG